MPEKWLSNVQANMDGVGCRVISAEPFGCNLLISKICLSIDSFIRGLGHLAKHQLSDSGLIYKTTPIQNRSPKSAISLYQSIK